MDSENNPARNPWLSRLRWVVLLVLVAGMYVWSWDAAGMQPSLLILNVAKARGIITDLLQPRLFTRGEEISEAQSMIAVPCDGATAEETDTIAGPQIRVSPFCAGPRDAVTVTGNGFRPNTSGRLYWAPADLEGRLADERFTTDADGSFSVGTDVPPLLAEQSGPSQLIAQVSWESGRLRPSEPLRTTISELIETVFLALMATTLGAVVAIPLSFLGARNIMPRTPWGSAVYSLTRGFFNVTRSIEPIILATIFAIWVGFGPFAGTLALSIVTIASLGKLYSEAAESIEPGPIEAITATGANRFQVIVYAVVPQIVPPYTAFTIYQWDINVRISTIIGFVGGGGIGFVLQTWINQTRWTWAAVAVWGIVVVVWAMDYTSARVREAIV